MKSSSISRAIELAKLAAQVGIKELRSGGMPSRIEQAVLIAKSLSQLKGAAMKAGQLLSLDLDNYFPPEAIEVLSQLQNAAVAHPYAEIEKIITSEIPEKNRRLIQSISPTPLGVASIGQVHKARYKNQDIVLKVQYANVAGSVESDLKILKTMAKSFCQVTGRKMNLDPLFLEFKSILEQELNYEAEAKFQNQFLQKIGELNKKSSMQYRVPETLPEISTGKVLSMKFEAGMTLRQWINSKPNETDKKRVAQAILDLYFHEFFEWGMVQTDPNLGNFLIDQTSQGISICLLDFGSTRTYSREFIKSYTSLLEFASRGESQKLKTLAIDFGLIDKRESEKAFQAFEDMLKIAIKPFFAAQGEFDFSDPESVRESQDAVKKMAQELIYSPPPYSIVFLHRKLGGVYAILKSLEVKLDVAPYWAMMRELAKG